MRIEENYSLLKHNTFGLDVSTRWFVEYDSEEDLRKLLSDEYFFSQSFWHIGQGSNLLFLGDYNGVIVHSLIQSTEIIREDENSVWIKAGAGIDWDNLVSSCVEKGWGGIENLSLIPGEVGSSAIQNIGAYGVEVADVIVEVHAYPIESGEKRIFTTIECQFGYRKSYFKQEQNRGKYFITHVVFQLTKKPEYNLDYGNLKKYLDGKEINLKTVRDTVIDIRRSKLPDPKEIGNAGSFFMNPFLSVTRYEQLQKTFPLIPHFPVSETEVKVPAAWLIDQCGLKGRMVGNAAVHEKQPLVLINTGGATGDEIASLAEIVQQAVEEKFGVELHPEVNYI